MFKEIKRILFNDDIYMQWLPPFVFQILNVKSLIN